MDDLNSFPTVQMIRKPDRKKEVGLYRLHRVRENYSHERIADRLLNLWQQLLNPKQKEVSQCV